MKRSLVALIWLASIGHAAADASLKEMIREASSCSNASLQGYASRTCDSPQTIAAMAVAICKDKWTAVANKAMGPPPADALPMERSRWLKTYSDAMENEYLQVAELKAIDIRTDAGRCGFE